MQILRNKISEVRTQTPGGGPDGARERGGGGREKAKGQSPASEPRNETDEKGEQKE